MIAYLIKKDIGPGLDRDTSAPMAATVRTSIAAIAKLGPYATGS
jgi:hypothetical protein